PRGEPDLGRGGGLLPSVDRKRAWFGTAVSLADRGGMGILLSRGPGCSRVSTLLLGRAVLCPLPQSSQLRRQRPLGGCRRGPVSPTPDNGWLLPAERPWSIRYARQRLGVVRRLLR